MIQFNNKPLKVKAKFIIRTEDKNKDDFFSIFDLIADSAFKPSKFGTHEPFKGKYSASSFNELYDLIRSGYQISNDNASNLIGLADRWGGLTDMDMTISQINQSEELDFVFKIFDVFKDKILYANIVPYDEFESKHKRVRELGKGKRVTSYRGNSTRNFISFMPGVYWFNFFGKELTTAFGKEVLTALTGVEYVDYGGDVIAFKISLPIAENNLASRLEVQNQIINQLFS